MPHKTAENARGPVLSIVLNPRFGGAVVLDGFGIAPVAMTKVEAKVPTRPTSFNAWNFRRGRTATKRAASAARRVQNLIARHRPARVVTGLSSRSSADLTSMQSAVVEIIRGAAVPFSIRPAVDGAAILGLRRPPTRRALAECLVLNFFPELRGMLDGAPRKSPIAGKLDGRRADIEFARYYRAAWQAAALGLLDLAEHEPRSAAALIQGGAVPLPSLSKLIADSDRRLHPDP